MVEFPDQTAKGAGRGDHRVAGPVQFLDAGRFRRREGQVAVRPELADKSAVDGVCADAGGAFHLQAEILALRPLQGAAVLREKEAFRLENADFREGQGQPEGVRPVGDHLPVEPVESVGPVLLLGEADQFLPADRGSADV